MLRLVTVCRPAKAFNFLLWASRRFFCHIMIIILNITITIMIMTMIITIIIIIMIIIINTFDAFDVSFLTIY